MIRVPRAEVQHGDVIGINEGERVIVCCPPGGDETSLIIPVSAVDKDTDVNRRGTWHRHPDFLPTHLTHVMVLHRANVEVDG